MSRIRNGLFVEFFVATPFGSCNLLQHIRVRVAMKRDEDPPEDPGSSGDVRWREQTPRDDLRRSRAQGTESDALDYFATEQWIEQFHREYDRETMESVLRYAARRLSLGGKVSPEDYAARELANDAVHDTLAGRTRWDPAKKKLKRHLCDVVKRRTYAQYERGERLPHVSIDALGPDGQSSTRYEMERVLREQLPDERAAADARADLAELRRRVADDADVLALIDARSHDHTSRADTMAVTGFSQQRYRAALRRLNCVVEAMRGELDFNRNGKSSK